MVPSALCQKGVTEDVLEFGISSLAGWWSAIVGYSATRWLPSLTTLILACLAYLVGSWILREVQRRFAAKSETDIDDKLVHAFLQALRITVVAWVLWQVLDTWVPVFGSESSEGQWIPYATQPTDWVWGIWIGLIFLPLSSFVGHVMRSFQANLLAHSSGPLLDETALPMINKFVRFAVVAVGVLLALTHLGIQIAPLLAGAGVVGLALSLAAKDTLSNLIAGVLLIMDRPFHVGDRIELWNAPNETGTWGDVIEIGLRATKIRNPDNLVVIVPNNEIMQRDIINYTMSGEHIRLRIPFSCAYESDIEQAKLLLKEAAAEVSGVNMEPEPIVIVRGFGPSEINLQLRVWIRQARNRRRIADEIVESAMQKFSAGGVEIPYPKQELYIRAQKPDEGLALESSGRSETR